MKREPTYGGYTKEEIEEMELEGYGSVSAIIQYANGDTDEELEYDPLANEEE